MQYDNNVTEFLRILGSFTPFTEDDEMDIREALIEADLGEPNSNRVQSMGVDEKIQLFMNQLHDDMDFEVDVNIIRQAVYSSGMN